MNPTRDLGELLRSWRERRRLSQLELALRTEISARHLSFLETGRARPGRETLLRLAESLEVPLRARNELLLAAGLAPEYPERPLDDAGLVRARRALDLVLAGHQPFPALAVDRHWSLVAANPAAEAFLVGVAPELLAPPVNVLRVSLHPEGLAPRIVNLAEWREHILARLRHQIDTTADPVLARLADELAGYPVPPGAGAGRVERYGSYLVPLELATEAGVLSFFGTTTVFGTPRDVTLAELAIEAFYPADEATAAALYGLAAETGAAR